MENDENQKKIDTKFTGHHISAGGFVFHKEKETGKISVLLIKNKIGEYWIPKGHIEEGEDHIKASFREIEEETGIEGEYLTYIGLCHIHKYSFIDKLGNNSTKEVYMNVFNTSDMKAVKLENGDTEIVDGGWYEFDDALEKIIPYSKDALKKAFEMFNRVSS